MSKTNNSSYITIKNPENKYIIDEFINYYKFIYSNYTTMNKTPKEIYYKLATIKRVIETISKYNKKINVGNDLTNIKGIGPKTIGRINEIIKTGKLSEIKEKEKQYESITELSTIYGIGPAKASVFYEQFGIKSIADLIKADANGKITLTHQMELGIKYKDLLVEKIPHELIKLIEKPILDKINLSDNDIIAIICGSYRRKNDFSSDIDILLTHGNITPTNNKQGFYLDLVVKALDKFFIIDKLTESSKRHFQGFASVKNIPNIKNYNKLVKNGSPDFNIKDSVIRLDIIIVPYSSYYTALMHFTGSASFNQKMRLHAKSMNMKLSEYGLYKHVGTKNIPIKINSEEDIFNNLLLKYIPPEKR
jgi:DNA polymerase/3'-5' exonuclease PolX